MKKKISVHHEGNNYYSFIDRKENKGYVHIPTSRNDKKAASPGELLLASLASCSCSGLLKYFKDKGKELTSLNVDIEANYDLTLSYTPFTDIKLIYHVSGNFNDEDMNNAIKYAFKTYCTVSYAMNPNINIHKEWIINA